MQAMESMPPSGRRLSIVTEASYSDVWIRITDSGPGLAPEMDGRTFRAFSTTKQNGMGLGLAMCRSIVTAHRGCISIDNQDATGGAIVQISLPRSGSLAAENAAMMVHPERQVGQETIVSG